MGGALGSDAESSDTDGMDREQREAAQDEAFHILVMYPDLEGRGLAPGGTADKLLAEHENVLAVVNGPNPTTLNVNYRDDVTVTLSPVVGLARSLRYGYHSAVGRADVIVRVDTQEHPFGRIDHLAEAAWKHGVAVGDLQFDVSTLREGSLEHHMQVRAFPDIFDLFTEGRLRMTGSHGMQAWRADVLKEVLPVAERIWDRADVRGAMRWGFDASMLLAADTLGITPHVKRYHAEKLRDRSRETVAGQYSDVMATIASYMKERYSREGAL